MRRAEDGDLVAYSLDELLRRVEEHREASLVLRELGKVFERLALGEHVARYRGRVVLAPVEAAAEDFGFGLEVEGRADAVGVIALRGGLYGVDEDVSVFKHFFGVGADELRDMYAGEGDPRYAVYLFKTQGFENSFFTVHTFTSFDMCASMRIYAKRRVRASPT